MDGLPYLKFLATGLVTTSPMYTAAFECTYGTFIRMEYDKSYDSMLSTPISFTDLIAGELLWAGTKGLFFSFAVLIVMYLAGVITPGLNLLTPVVGFFTGLMFGALSLLVTSFVRNINHFNFYFTGLLSPMFFFSGVVFSLSSLPAWALPLAEALPLTHAVRLARYLEYPVFSVFLYLMLCTYLPSRYYAVCCPAQIV
jgi:lipooligosaccharide transport system permease protein